MTPVLTKDAPQVETIWDQLLPELLRELPQTLADLDRVLDGPALLQQFEKHWGRANLRVGRPSIPMATYLRLMALKQSHGWGYERLTRQVGDSFQFRRFCRIPITSEVPDESTLRKLTRRLGSALVADLIREVVKLAVAERGFKVRALRCDSTVQEADVRYPTDSGLLADAIRVLPRLARRVQAALPGVAGKVRDRGRAAGRRLRELHRSLRRRSGDAQEQVQRLTEQIAKLAKASLGQARRLLREAQLELDATRCGSGRRAQSAVTKLEEMIALGAKVVEQVRQRYAGEKIQDRVVSLFDAAARPIRKGKLAKPNQFGCTVQYTELSPHTRRGARGLLVPPQVGIGNVPEDKLLPGTVTEILGLDLKPIEAVFDGVFTSKSTTAELARLGSDIHIFIAGRRTNPGSRRTRKRLASHRVGCEGRIAHLKRELGAGRSRLKGAEGARIWSNWAALAYNVETVSRLPIKKEPQATAI